MTRILVWDVPTRLFHLLLAASFAGAFAIPHLVDDDSPLFMLHMLLGGTMAFMVLLRLLWGFIGPRHARFASFPLTPSALVAYLRGTLRADGPRYPGHNPASAIASLLMFALSLGLAGTGLAMGSAGEWAEELHEALAWAFMITVAVHLAGVAWHSLRHREAIPLAMVDGHKLGDEREAISTARPIVGIVFLMLSAVWMGVLVHQYDAPTRTLAVPGLAAPIALGESEGEEHEGPRRGHDDDDDDDD